MNTSRKLIGRVALIKLSSDNPKRHIFEQNTAKLKNNTKSDKTHENKRLRLVLRKKWE